MIRRPARLAPWPVVRRIGIDRAACGMTALPPATGRVGWRWWRLSWARGLNRSRGSLRQAANPTPSSPTP
jgi:hypothetical protein